jgi:hypothetical protein
LTSIGQKTNISSVIVGAAEVVATVGADQFAVMAGEAMTAGGADLAVVIDTGIGGHTTL